MQCLLLLTRMHHSYTTHAVSLVRVGGGGGGGGGGCRGVDELRGEFLVLVMQCLILAAD